MRIKEIQVTANIAWSPAEHYPIYLAAGTTAQQFDASFSTTSQLDLYLLDLSEPGNHMELKASIPTQQRFHKLIWGSLGISGGDKSSGVIIGGADQGHILLFDAAKILRGKHDETGSYLLSDSKKHSGAVKALDLNPFQPNLLASGATESEIFIWDLNSPAAPMTPGKPSLPLDEITCLGWNRQVQHILASTFSSRCVVWDLRKNEQIIKISDNTSRMKCKSVAWHPKVPTQLCLASEDDQLPVIQLWDLRQATAPMNTFEGHHRGILAMDWCTQDPDLLLSCGKDNRVLIWNPNSPNPGGEILSELLTSSQWCFETAWCTRNPSCIATADFDGHVQVHSIMGGRELAVQATSNMIAESFPGMESAPALQAPQQQVIVHQQLKKAPKWLRPLCGASFGFGGKLVSFGNESQAAVLSTTRQVHISQVVTEEQLTARSQELEAALHSGNLAEFCAKKSAINHEMQDAWIFLGANFSSSPRQELLQLLGYEHKMSSETDLAQGAESITLADTFDSIAAEVKTFSIPKDQSVEGRICRALISGDLTTAVDVCFADKRFADALILAMSGPPELLTNTRNRYFKQMKGDVARLIQSVVTKDWHQVVQHCDISNWKEALATSLTYADDNEFSSLCQAIGQRLESESEAQKDAHLCYIIAGNMEKLVDCWLRTDDGTTSSLQELVEQVMVLRQAQNYWSRPSSTSHSGHLTQQLCKYASLLAGQGNLEAALTYLDMSKDDSMVELKERLEHALGRNAPKLTSGGVTGSHGAANQFSQMNRYPSMGATKPPTPVNNYYNNQDSYSTNSQAYPQRSTTPYQTPNWAPPTSNSAQYSNPVLAYNPAPPPVSLPPVSQMPPAQTMPPSVPHFAPLPPTAAPAAAPPVAPPVTPVAPPPTGNSVSRVGLLSQRSRVYVQDPSITSGRGGYFTPGVNSPYPAMGMSSTQASQASVMFQPNGQFNSAPTYSQPQTGFSANQYSTPSAQSTSFHPSVTPLNNATGYENSMQNAPTLFNPEQTSTSFLSGSFAQPSVFETVPSITPPPLTTSALPAVPVVPVTTATLGWNDPPPLATVNKPKIEVPVEAITQPIAQPLQPLGHVEQPAVPVMQPLDGMHNSSMSFAEFNQQSSIPEPAQAAPVAALPPIPSEHIIIHEVLHTLKEKCVGMAMNAQMKRKLDDVGKKLESLDDLLRKNMLMSTTLQGLHQIVQSAQAGDYATSLSLHAQVVVNTPFTEIGTFISGLKVLLQMSQQLGISYH